MKKVLAFLLIVAMMFVVLCSCGETVETTAKATTEVTTTTEEATEATTEAALYSVIFVNYDNSIITSQIVKEGNAATAPAVPERTGYTFSGWDQSFDKITTNLTIKAVYEINTYTVTFVDYDGTVLKTQEVPYWYSATAPSNPSRADYVFNGWDKSFYNITSDITITALYKLPFDFELNIDGKGYTMTRYIGSATECIIPSEYNGLPVTAIGKEAFSYCENLTSITIPESVTSIGDVAFARCTSLTSINIPNGVTSIGDGAFYSCSSLTSIAIPNGVTSIGDRAFAGCSNLTSITIPDSVTSIGYGAFAGCSNLTSITIPDSVTSIGESAFESCKSLTSITIPNGVTSIGDRAFVGCSSLTSITIPDSVTSIGHYAFADCSSLTSITYNGTKAQWEAIKKGGSWISNTPNYTVHCTDGDIKK